jgi:hypothetical protein
MPIFILFVYLEKNRHFGAAEVNQINIVGLKTNSYLKHSQHLKYEKEVVECFRTLI